MPGRLFPATVVCNPDEPCFNLSELNQFSPPPDQAMHRFQILVVVRNDKLAEYRRDLGLSARYGRPEFRVPGGIVTGGGRIEILHTVAELQEVADHLRAEPFALPFQPADLTKEYYDYLDQVPRVRRHESTIGPLVRLRR